MSEIKGFSERFHEFLDRLPEVPKVETVLSPRIKYLVEHTGYTESGIRRMLEGSPPPAHKLLELLRTLDAGCNARIWAAYCLFGISMDEKSLGPNEDAWTQYTLNIMIATAEKYGVNIAESEISEEGLKSALRTLIARINSTEKSIYPDAQLMVNIILPNKPVRE